MNKGTVLSIDKKKAYVFTEDCRLIRVAAEPQMAGGKEITLDRTRIQNQRQPRSLVLKPALIALSLVLFLALVLVGQGSFLTPVYATLSVDVNPSVQFHLNRSLSVISVQSMNQEAARLLEGLELKGLNWKDALLRWTGRVAQDYPEKARTVLISAVMPEQAEALKAGLVAMEQNRLDGLMNQAEVRVIYSFDQAVIRQARRNQLSVGRQMLLNKAQYQNQNKIWEKEEIGRTALGELVHDLLDDEERDQTQTTRKRATERITETLTETTGSGTHETNQQGQQEPLKNAGDQPTYQETHRETNRETTGSGSADPSGTQITNQETNRETNRETTGSGSPDPSGTQEANQETNRETNRETTGSGPTASSGSQQVGNG
ncbi:MAG: anti-sigma factor domain-containing protein [Eubacteriales bacterium]|nr:anti-sigma factor domain-containing protein [Eubacteriales bacterium]